MDVKVIPEQKLVKENVSLEGKPLVEPKQYKAQKVELSETIKAFDEKVNKPKVYTEDPTTHEAVAFKKDGQRMPAATEMIMDRTYNTVGKMLGVDTLHDWGKYYDKIHTITEWAKQSMESDDPAEIILWIGEKARQLPNLGASNIDNLNLFARLYFTNKK